MQQIKSLLPILFFCISMGVFHKNIAQMPTAPEDQLDWWGDLEGFYNQQAFATLKLVDQALTKYPPSLPEPMERQMAMLMLDGILHEEQAPQRSSVQDFLHRRINEVANSLVFQQIQEGAMIWKLYNEGFIVRTPTVTIAFDLSRAAYIEGFAIPNIIMKRVIDQCDALFVSHRHQDHADKWVAQRFIDQGKPVVAPEEVWQEEDFHSQVTHLRRLVHTTQPLPIQNHSAELTVVIYPGHQGADIPNNVSLVITPEGMSFAQTGDQSWDEDFEWIDQVGMHHRVDVVFPNCWTTDIVRLANGFKPNLLITGHENEMNHTVDHREPNWLTYTRLRRCTYPYLVMTWGEAYHYQPTLFDNKIGKNISSEIE